MARQYSRLRRSALLPFHLQPTSRKAPVSREINIVCHTLQKKQQDETNSFQHRSEEQRPVSERGWTERRVLIITTGSIQDVALQSYP